MVRKDVIRFGYPVMSFSCRIQVQRAIGLEGQSQDLPCLERTVAQQQAERVVGIVSLKIENQI